MAASEADELNAPDPSLDPTEPPNASCRIFGQAGMDSRPASDQAVGCVRAK